LSDSEQPPSNVIDFALRTRPASALELAELRKLLEAISSRLDTIETALEAPSGPSPLADLVVQALNAHAAAWTQPATELSARIDKLGHGLATSAESISALITAAQPDLEESRELGKSARSLIAASSQIAEAVTASAETAKTSAAEIADSLWSWPVRIALGLALLATGVSGWSTWQVSQQSAASKQAADNASAWSKAIYEQMQGLEQRLDALKPPPTRK